MSPSPAQEAWQLMGQIFMENRRNWGARFTELGLAPMQAFALKSLDPERPMAMSALADLLHCDNSNITGIADRLEAAGLVERRPAPADRRVKTLALTDRGIAARDQVIAAMSTPPAPVAGLEPADAAALRDILRRALSQRLS